MLQIANAQLQDTGRYTCEAINIAGKTEKNYNLNVLGESQHTVRLGMLVW